MHAAVLVKYLIEDDEDEDFSVKEFAPVECVLKWMTPGHAELESWWTDNSTWSSDLRAAHRFTKPEAEAALQQFKIDLTQYNGKVPIVIEPAPFDSLDMGYCIVYDNGSGKIGWWKGGGGWTHRLRQAQRFTKEEAESQMSMFGGSPNISVRPVEVRK